MPDSLTCNPAGRGPACEVRDDGPSGAPTTIVLADGGTAHLPGSDGLLQPVGCVPGIRSLVQTALRTGCRVIVALLPGDPRSVAALDDLPATILTVPGPGVDMVTILSTCAGAVEPGSAAMILPADMPELDLADLQSLISAHRAFPDAIFRGSALDVPGHPILIPHDLLADLQGLAGDEGVRGLIGRHAERLRLVPLPGRHAIPDRDASEIWPAGTTTTGTDPERWTKAPPGPVGDAEHPTMRDPLMSAAQRPDDAVLAVITDVIGPSYRRPGTMMALFADGSAAGSLTNGCIEGDLMLHAARSLETGQVAHLHYGSGSPYFDIRLPCGGGLNIALFPRPDRAVLEKVATLRAQRRFFSLQFDAAGRPGLQKPMPTGWYDQCFAINLLPDIFFSIYGDGPEAVMFTRLVHAAGYPHRLLTPSLETMEAARLSGCVAEYAAVDAPDAPGARPGYDARTAVLTFFHDHDREIPILRTALESDAFYVGAQGSRRVAEARLRQLQTFGLATSRFEKLHSPIGLIPSARDVRLLAVSVLAEVIDLADKRAVWKSV